jgi:hypothetical protein
MLWWLVDNAGLFYFLLGLAALALAAAWWLNRQRKYLVGFAGVIGALVLIWLLGRLIVTDRQQLQRNVEEMAQAIGDNRPDNLVKHLARDFLYQNLTRETAESHIGDLIRRFALTSVRIASFEVNQLSRSEGKATVGFRAWVFSSLAEAGQPFWCTADFVLEEGQWRMKAIRVYQGFVNTDQEIRVPVP